MKRPAVARSQTQDISGLSHQWSATELRQLDNYQHPQILYLYVAECLSHTHSRCPEFNSWQLPAFPLSSLFASYTCRPISFHPLGTNLCRWWFKSGRLVLYMDSYFLTTWSASFQSELNLMMWLWMTAAAWTPVWGLAVVYRQPRLLTEGSKTLLLVIVVFLYVLTKFFSYLACSHGNLPFYSKRPKVRTSNEQKNRLAWLRLRLYHLYLMAKWLYKLW